jgi:cellobiose phosphorylase
MIDNLVKTCLDNLRFGRKILAGMDSDQQQMLLNRYAEFRDIKRHDGFLIDSSVWVKTLHTPRPYVHLMASNHDEDEGQWGSYWDQHRGGFSCVDTVLAGKMSSHLDTNYVPTSPAPTDVREFWIHERGIAWPIFPVAHYEEGQYQDYSCTFGLDTYQLNSMRNEIESRLSVFVHPQLPLEIWQVTLKNTSSVRREFSWFSRIRISLDSYPFYYFVPRVVCHGAMEDGCMIFTNQFKANKHPRASFFACSTGFDGFDMMQEVFQGSGGRAPIPVAVQGGKCRNSLGKAPYDGLIAAGQYNAYLAVGEEKTWTLVFGKCPTDVSQRHRFLTEIVQKDILANPEKSLNQLHEVWQKKINRNVIQTQDDNLNRYFNVWSKYQSRNQVRFVRALDKIGYRDIIQDAMGVVDFESSYVRKKIVEALRFQYPDGRAVRQYEKHPGGGLDTRQYQDSVVWLPDTVTRYIKQTGDFDLLDTQVPFLDPVNLQVDENNTDSVYAHLCRAIDSLVADQGHHGLCKIGYGDWNDSLSGIGGKQGVSVWLSCACVYACKIMAELAEHLGKMEDGKRFTHISDTLTRRINDHAWDGEWYVYAINDDGIPIGSKKNEEGRIHLNVNTWALFTGIASAAGREQQVLESIEKMSTSSGHMLLLPPYTEKSSNLVGKIADQTPGMIENGSIYMHGESFYLFALISLGQSDKWYAELGKTLLGNLVPDLVMGPPHQQSNFFIGPDHEFFGQSMFSNATGSVAWYRIGIEQILGVIPEYKGIKILPAVPSDWKEYRIRRNLRGTDLAIHFQRTGEFAITMDGNRIVGNLIPAEKIQVGQKHQIEVTF